MVLVMWVGVDGEGQKKLERSNVICRGSVDGHER